MTLCGVGTDHLHYNSYFYHCYLNSWRPYLVLLWFTQRRRSFLKLRPCNLWEKNGRLVMGEESILVHAGTPWLRHLVCTCVIQLKVLPVLPYLCYITLPPCLFHLFCVIRLKSLLVLPYLCYIALPPCLFHLVCVIRLKSLPVLPYLCYITLPPCLFHLVCVVRLKSLLVP